MNPLVIFVAPFVLDTTLRFVAAGYIIIRDPDSALVEQALRQIAGLVRVELVQGWIAR